MRILFLFLLLSASACQTDEAENPELQTNSADAVGLTSAVLRGVLEEVGPIKPIRYGFLWSTQAGVTIASAEHNLVIGEAYEGDLAYSTPITNLQADTEYFVRAFAANASFTSIFYGDELSFRTARASQYLTTLIPENIASSSVMLKGEIISLNELENATYGFVWSLIPFTSILNSQVIVVGDTSTPRVYETTLSLLQPSTTYYYRSFISNANGTVIVYGEQVSFTTTSN